ncbi:hypothetical protein [Nevskia sp.]|uniref:hypothetical protein n=1 Tax=Nevskia sp. TaxID=1929292 RepID=UPI003F71F9A8
MNRRQTRLDKASLRLQGHLWRARQAHATAGALAGIFHVIDNHLNRRRSGELIELPTMTPMYDRPENAARRCPKAERDLLCCAPTLPCAK